MGAIWWVSEVSGLRCSAGEGVHVSRISPRAVSLSKCPTLQFVDRECLPQPGATGVFKAQVASVPPSLLPQGPKPEPPIMG